MPRRTFKDQMIELIRAYRKEFIRNWRLFRESRIGVFGLGIILFFVFMALLAPVIPIASERDPMYWSGPSRDYTEIGTYWYSQTGAGVISPDDPFAQWGSNLTPFALHPVMVGGGVRTAAAYFGTEKGFYAIDPDSGGKPGARPNPGSTGERLPYTLEGIGHVVGQPVVNARAEKNINSNEVEMRDDRVYFATEDGKVYSYLPEFYNQRIQRLRATGVNGQPAVFDTGETITGSLLLDYVGEGAVKSPRFPYDGRLFGMGGQNSWLEKSLNGTRPSPRFGHAMAAAGSTVVLFGGETLSGSNQPILDNVTWVYDAGSDAWTSLTVPSPPPLMEHAMTYDSASGLVVLYGGRTSLTAGTASDETWTFDLNTSVWTRVSTLSPPGRYGHALAYDAQTGKVVMFGGKNIFGRYLNETWVYDPGTSLWSQVPGPAPPPRAEMAMSASDTGKIVMFGGTRDGEYLNDTWEFDTSSMSWLRVDVPGPSPRYGHTLVFDSGTGQHILFGGKAVEGDVGYNNDTWAYSSGTWTRQNSTRAPSPRFQHAAVYSVSTGEVLLFGGGQDTGWSYDRIFVITTSHIFKLKETLIYSPGNYANESVLTEVWNITLPYTVRADGVYIASAGVIAVIGDDGGLHAYDIRTGDAVWEFFPEKGKGLLNPDASPGLAFDPLTSEWNTRHDALYAPSLDGMIYAISPSNGTEIRSYSTGTTDPLWTPNVDEAEKNLQVGSTGGFVYEFAAEKNRDISPGTLLWKLKIPGEIKVKPYASTSFLSGDRVYVMSTDGNAYLLKPNRGNQSADVSLKIGILAEGGEMNEAIYFTDLSGRQVVLLSSKDGHIGLYNYQGVYTAPLPPGCYRSGTCYILGTDFIGRDVFSQLVWGSQLALLIGFLAAFFSVAIGLAIGLVSGYFAGKTDVILMRFTDVILVLPGLPLLIVLAAVLGASIYNLVVIIALLGWPGTARIIRAMVLSLKERPFIDAARIAGASHARIMFKHIAPNVFPLVFLFLTFAVSGAIIAEASLSFIGLGDPTHMSWGMMLYYAQYSGNALKAWWWLIPPGLAITFICSGFFLVGRAFEQIINPRLRKR